jgi:subfamily B ATP-binding cassette protein MsbA
MRWIAVACAAGPFRKISQPPVRFPHCRHSTMIDLFRNVLNLARPYSGRLAIGLLAGFLAGLANPLLMVSVKLVVEVVFAEPGSSPLAEQLRSAPPMLRGIGERILASLPNGDIHGSKLAMLLVIASIPGAMFLRGALTYLNFYLVNWVSIRAVMDLRVKVFAHLLTLPSSYFSKTSTGTLMAQLQAATAIQSVLGPSLITIIKEPITVVSLAALLFWQQPQLTMVAAVVLPFTLLPFVIYSRRVRRSANVLSQQMSDQGKLVHESLTGYRILKAYNLEEKAASEFHATSRLGANHQMRMMRAGELPGVLIEFLGAVGVAAFFAYIAILSPVKMTPGDLLQFVGCIFLLYQPIKSLIKLHNQLEQARIISQMVFGILETKNDLIEPANPKALHAAGAAVRFEHIDFSYGEKAVLQDFDLEVRSGALVALVGSSGAGKTTVTNLLLRFYDPQKGRITIGGIDIRDVMTRDLRNQIAVVTQDTILFNDTIHNNIALGRPGATREEVIEAAKHAHAHAFITEKQDGYDCVIGEKGVMLSGGQRQRLAIARAILKNAPILILDEATSSLDAESERAVQAALDELMEGRTTICIAHRLSTIQNADVIVVMDQGRIVETGPPRDLLAKDGAYRKLHELQFAQ